MKTTPKGPFLGINNRLPDFALHVPREGDFLRQAENVDIDNSRHIRRRKAFALLYALTDSHSLYMDSDTTGFLALPYALYRITLPSYTQTLITTLTSNDPISYVPYAGSLYWSNGTDSGRIESGTNYPIGLPTPATPAVASIAGGMFAGWYQVTVAYRNSVTGEEGGVAPSANHQLVATGGLRITLPAAAVGATHVDVFVSTVNGSVPMFQTTVVAGTASVDVTTHDMTGREAIARFEEPLPAGTLFLHNGALCSFSGDNIYRGVPYRPGYHIRTESRITFPAEVTNAISAQNGVYVTTTKMTYWLAGTDLKDVQTWVDVLPYGGVRGTTFAIPFDQTVGWFGNLGFVIGDIGGQAKCDMASNVDLTAPASGVSIVASDGGYYRVTACGYTMNLETSGVTTYTDYDFTSAAGDYATKTDGIYVLTSTGDVPYVVGFGKENFGDESMKLLPAIYLGCASDVPMQMRIQTPEDDYTYDSRTSGVETRIQRVDPGKGLRSNWFDLSLLGESQFTLATLSFAAVGTQRRI